MFAQLIKRLRQEGLNSQADALMEEVGKEWAKGSSSVVKKANKAAAEFYLAKTVEALEKGQPAPVSPTGYKYELAQAVAAALKGDHSRQRLLTPTPPVEPETSPKGAHVHGADWIERVLIEGVKVRLEYDEGIFSARAGDTVADGKTWKEALAALVNKLSQSKETPEQPGGEKASGEYAFSRRSAR